MVYALLPFLPGCSSDRLVLRISGGLDQLGSGVLNAADGSATYAVLSLADEWQYWLGCVREQSEYCHE